MDNMYSYTCLSSVWRGSHSPPLYSILTLTILYRTHDHKSLTQVKLIRRMCLQNFPRHRPQCIFPPPMQTLGCRQNTSPNFSTIGPSFGYKVPSTLVFEHWQLLLQQYPNSHFPNILAGTSACVNVVIFCGGEHTILLSSRAGYLDNPRYNMS